MQKAKRGVEKLPTLTVRLKMALTILYRLHPTGFLDVKPGSLRGQVRKKWAAECAKWDVDYPLPGWDFFKSAVAYARAHPEQTFFSPTP